MSHRVQTSNYSLALRKMAPKKLRTSETVTRWTLTRLDRCWKRRGMRRHTQYPTNRLGDFPDAGRGVPDRDGFLELVFSPRVFRPPHRFEIINGGSMIRPYSVLAVTAFWAAINRDVREKLSTHEFRVKYQSTGRCTWLDSYHRASFYSGTTRPCFRDASLTCPYAQSELWVPMPKQPQHTR